MAGDRLDHFVITSGQIQLDRRIFPEPVRFVVARLLVLHLLFDGTHFLGNDTQTLDVVSSADNVASPSDIDQIPFPLAARAKI